MARIPLLQVGCTGQEVIDAINALIAAHNDGESVAVLSYNDLADLPQINGVELKGDKSTDALLIALAGCSDYETLMATLATKAYADEMKSAALAAAEATARNVLAYKLDADLGNIDTTSTIADGSYIPVVTDGDEKKVKMETVSAYTELKSTTSRQSSTGQGESSQPSESGGTVPQSTSGVFDVTVTPDLWEENDIWRYVAIVHDDNAARLRSAFASPASETLQEWSDSPISLVSIEDGVLVFASPKALPAESITMKVYYKR